MSFFLLRCVARTAAKALMSFWVCASLAHMWSSHSLTSRAQGASSVARTGLRLMLSLKVELELSLALVRAFTSARGGKDGIQVLNLNFPVNEDLVALR